MRMTLYRLLGIAVVGSLLSACASGPEACQHDVVTGMDRCQPTSGDYGEAVGTAAAAGAAWAVAGCKVNGCAAPYRCNEKTKMCERIPCGEGQGQCPPPYACDLDDHVCR